MNNPIVNLESDASPKYSSHWHLRLNQCRDDGLTHFLNGLDALVGNGWLTYAVVGASKDDTGRHLHIALGTSRSMKKITLSRKLGLANTSTMKLMCDNYYLNGLYKDSTIGANLAYIRNGHQIIFEKGEILDDQEIKIKDLPAKF